MKKILGSTPYYQFDIFSDHTEILKHGLSTRHGGVSDTPFASLNMGFQYEEDPAENVVENYGRFCEAVSVPVDNLVVPVQNHTDVVVAIREVEAFGLGRAFEQVDGFITDVVGLPISVRFADCQGLLFFDPVKRVVAAVHSGWRGNTKNIIGKCVRKMVAEFDSNAANILVGIGPSLGPCCAEFSNPREELPAEMHRYIETSDDDGAGGHVNLWQCAVDQLLAEGVLANHIELAEVCTSCNTDEFFSYRGDHRQSGARKPMTGRMAGVIMLK
jgi:polyphenol oxidase